ncbi:carbohydrate esterase family 8 protein [Aureobasidium namibiae CBS 147.97]|uniref:Pectinesterase n=1 Tax=Aureobasidium namibiae CBS 147.97 TaxID=1043004 RepID=A0A074WVS4_9PEZI
MLTYILALCLNLCLALAASRTSAPSGALVVSKAPSKGQYSKIQDAVNALSTSSTTAQSIFIEAGTYSEQVYIAPRKAALTVYGYSTNTDDYNQNVVTITQKLSLNSVATDDLTATLRAWSTNFKLYNVNLANTYGNGGQALALSASASNQGYYACKFLGFQDTILAQTGTQLFAKSYIEGATDFIFGQHGLAWFTHCDIRVLAANLGFIVASGRASNEAGYYVLDHCSIAAKSGATVPKGAYYLGRPWGDYARVAVQSTTMTNVINADGWHIWNTGDENTDHVTFGEYGNTGDGAAGTRKFETKLSKAIAITDVLGSGYASAAYIDKAYL